MSGEQQPVMRDDYQVVSQCLDPRRIQLGIEAATGLRDYIAQQYLPDLMLHYPPHRKRIALQFDDQSDTTVFGSSFGPHPDYAPDLDSAQFIGLKLRHYENSWSLRLRANRYRCDGTRNKVASYYTIDAENDLVLRAQLETRVLTSNDCDPSMQSAVWRRIYDRHLNGRDCFRLQNQLQRTARRCIALAR